MNKNIANIMMDLNLYICMPTIKKFGYYAELRFDSIYYITISSSFFDGAFKLKFFGISV